MTKRIGTIIKVKLGKFRIKKTDPQPRDSAPAKSNQDTGYNSYKKFIKSTKFNEGKSTFSFMKSKV
jgi:hypothetical protein